MTRKRLRILVVSPDLPYPPSWGFGTRVYQLIKSLAQSHSVTLLSYAYPNQRKEMEALSRYCEEVITVIRKPAAERQKRIRQLISVLSTRPFHGTELQSGDMQAAIDECLQHGGYDVVQVESSQLAFEYRHKVHIVLDEHNIESELLTRMRQQERSFLRRVYNATESRKHRVVEDRMWAGATACVVTSERERLILASRAPTTPTVVVPNGVDPDFFSPSNEPIVPNSMVFTGVLSYRPNLDAIRYFIDDILPIIRQRRPSATLTVVGAGSPRVRRSLTVEGVDVTGWVPDVRPFVHRAAAVIVPIRMGSGTRLKVVEALAMRKAVVSTAIGCEGLDVVNGEHLMIADGREAFAEAVLQLFDDPTYNVRLGAAGRELVCSNYSWQRCGDILSEYYGTLSAGNDMAG